MTVPIRRSQLAEHRDKAMHLRDISLAQFEGIALELANAHRRLNRVEIITGDHKDLGATVLVRLRDNVIAIVNKPAALDALTDGASCSDGVVLARAMRPGKS